MSAVYICEWAVPGKPIEHVCSEPTPDLVIETLREKDYPIPIRQKLFHTLAKNEVFSYCQDSIIIYKKINN